MTDVMALIGGLEGPGTRQPRRQEPGEKLGKEGGLDFLVIGTYVWMFRRTADGMNASGVRTPVIVVC
jgi:hypothetical protein